MESEKKSEETVRSAGGIPIVARSLPPPCALRSRSHIGNCIKKSTLSGISEQGGWLNEKRTVT